jgi:hypothetical protein
VYDADFRGRIDGAKRKSMTSLGEVTAEEGRGRKCCVFFVFWWAGFNYIRVRGVFAVGSFFAQDSPPKRCTTSLQAGNFAPPAANRHTSSARQTFQKKKSKY